VNYIDSRTIRIAWLGGAGSGGGVGGYGRDLLRGLLRLGQDVTLFTGEEPAGQHALLDADAVAGGGTLAIEHQPSWWKWDCWYSRHPMATFTSSLVARSQVHRKLVGRLVELNQRRPFDVVVQFSQFELLSMGKRLDALPPVVLLPCVHAAGELRWHRAESAIARQSERWWSHAGVRANLTYRAACQKRDAKRVAAVLGMSERFNELIRQDYGVSADRQAVIYQPAVDLDAGPGPLVRQRVPGDPVRLVFVGRIAVRKGIERIVELSRRLAKLPGRPATIEVVGGASVWSNYTGELSKLEPSVGTYLGAMSHPKILELLSQADALLVPSRYEPGGIVVAEAAAQGCLPVVSDEVGSAEPLSDDACERFADADGMDGFEAAVRRTIERVDRDGPALRERVALAAQTQFGLEAQAQRLLNALRNVVDRRAVVDGNR
jgi:glycosyltransferase involved in cell wall biosynthesis